MEEQTHLLLQELQAGGPRPRYSIIKVLNSLTDEQIGQLIDLYEKSSQGEVAEEQQQYQWPSSNINGTSSNSNGPSSNPTVSWWEQADECLAELGEDEIEDFYRRHLTGVVTEPGKGIIEKGKGKGIKAKSKWVPKQLQDGKWQWVPNPNGFQMGFTQWQ